MNSNKSKRCPHSEQKFEIHFALKNSPRTRILELVKEILKSDRPNITSDYDYEYNLTNTHIQLVKR